MIPIIYPYRMGSKSATTLARALGTKKVWPDRNFRCRHNHLIINWGSSDGGRVFGDIDGGHYGGWLNPIMNVRDASNKLRALEILDSMDRTISIPEFSVGINIAQQWLSEGHTVVERHVLNGSGGRGIRIVNTSEDLLEAPLYTKYIKKQHEYRIHVFQGRVIDIQQKRKRREVSNDEVNYQVRNHINGWVFCRDNIHEPDESLMDMSIRAVSALGLDFGAVDVIWNRNRQQGYVLEVNTAPGLEGTTLGKYVGAIQSLL